jgi:hypothetical protein
MTTETNVHGLRIREAYATAEKLIDAEIGPAFSADRDRQNALDEFYTGDAAEDGHRTSCLIWALTEFAGRAVDQLAEEALAKALA